MVKVGNIDIGNCKSNFPLVAPLFDFVRLDLEIGIFGLEISKFKKYGLNSQKIDIGPIFGPPFLVSILV